MSARNPTRKVSVPGTRRTATGRAQELVRAKGFLTLEGIVRGPRRLSARRGFSRA